MSPFSTTTIYWQALVYLIPLISCLCFSLYLSQYFQFFLDSSPYPHTWNSFPCLSLLSSMHYQAPRPYTQPQSYKHEGDHASLHAFPTVTPLYWPFPTLGMEFITVTLPRPTAAQHSQINSHAISSEKQPRLSLVQRLTHCTVIICVHVLLPDILPLSLYLFIFTIPCGTNGTNRFILCLFDECLSFSAD